MLYIPEDLQNKDIMKLIKLFQKAVDLLTDVQPIHSILFKRKKKMEKALEPTLNKLRNHAALPNAASLQSAMQHPDFMQLSKEFKKQLMLEKEGLNVAKKVIEACQDPGSVKIKWAGMVANFTLPPPKKVPSLMAEVDVEAEDSRFSLCRHALVMGGFSAAVGVAQLSLSKARSADTAVFV